MITFITTAKPFRGNNGVHQINAIRSWKRLHSEIEILLCGDGAGYEDVVRRFDIIHLRDVKTTELGTPLVSSMFELAEKFGKHRRKVLINCDIILAEDFLTTFIEIERYLPIFLMVGQRWSVNIENIHKDGVAIFDRVGWVDDLCRQGRLFGCHGIEYFAYTGFTWEAIPPFAVGRPRYDNWLIYHCLLHKIPVVDVTDFVTAFHQEHNYAHLAGGDEEFRGGIESRRNIALAKDLQYYCTIQDAQFRYTDGKLERNWCRGDSERCVQVYQMLHPDFRMIRTRFGRFLLQAYFELIIRLTDKHKERIKLLVKFIPWFILKATGRG